MSDHTPSVQGAASRLRIAERLVIAYVVLSIATVAALALFAFIAPQLTSIEAWVRAIIIAGTSLLTWAFARRARAGSAKALLRLRIVVVILIVAFGGVLFFLPLPLWMVIEQVVCCLLLVAVAAMIFTRSSPNR